MDLAGPLVFLNGVAKDPGRTFQQLRARCGLGIEKLENRIEIAHL